MQDYSLQANTRFLHLLAQKYPTISAASSRIVALQAVMQLPKGTEHFLSDLHGEYEPFIHMLKNASGVIYRKISELYSNTLPVSERRELATVIYYPEEKLEQIRREKGGDMDAWYRQTLDRLISVARVVASKYTQNKVRGSLPGEYAYILYELISFTDYKDNRHFYYHQMIDTILSIGVADDIIAALAAVIQRLAVDNLHIIGDIYDRGPGAHIIMDALMDYHQVDIQWGNHDILWMGAAAGSRPCIAQALINTLKYGNIDTLEEGYGISLRELSGFAAEIYQDDPCEAFRPHLMEGQRYERVDTEEVARMHKAVAVLLFKLESELVRRRPEFDMEDRSLITRADWRSFTVEIDGKSHALRDTSFPTIDPDDPARLTEGEQLLLDHLRVSFLHAGKLQQHARFLFSRGGMYRIQNCNLLYHGCIPLDENGQFTNVRIFGEPLFGRALLEKCEVVARQGFFAQESEEEKRFGEDMLWYLWCGKASPLFGKDRMTSFERYLVEDSATWAEKKNPYYRYMDDEEAAMRILREFGISPEEGHIINGHIPVERKKGESPIKAGGRLLVIDGGLSRAYQDKTGTAGYTLISSSHDMNIIEHEPFGSIKEAIGQDIDLHSKPELVEVFETRQMIADTDTGETLRAEIRDLHMLIQAFRRGLVKEKGEEESGIY